MRLILYGSFLLLIFTSKIYCDEISTWQVMLGGSTRDDTGAVQQTADGGYVVAGISFSTDIPNVTNKGKYDCYIIKLDSRGSVVWQKMIGGSGQDFASSIKQTFDGGFIVAGSSDSNDISETKNAGNNDYYIVKLNKKGNILWQKMVGGSERDEAESIQQTADGGYIVAGSSYSDDIPGVINHGKADCFIVKLDSAGNILWQKMIGGANSDFAESIQQTTDGGYIVAGSSNSIDIRGVKKNSFFDCYVIKLDSESNIVWQKMIGGNNNEHVHSIQQTSDGGFVAAGCSDSDDITGVKNHGWRPDCYILKLDSAGNILWQKMIGGNHDENTYSIQQTKDSGYIIAGYSESTDIPGTKSLGVWDYYIIKLDDMGSTVWQKMLGGGGWDYAKSIQQTSDGGYIVAGGSDSRDIAGVENHGDMDFYIIKLDASGNLIK